MVMDLRKKPLRSWDEILMARRFRLLRNSDNVNLAIYSKDTRRRGFIKQAPPWGYGKTQEGRSRKQGESRSRGGAGQPGALFVGVGDDAAAGVADGLPRFVG